MSHLWCQIKSLVLLDLETNKCWWNRLFPPSLSNVNVSLAPTVSLSWKNEIQDINSIILHYLFSIHCVCYYTQSGVITAFNAFSLLFDDVLGVRYTVKKLVERNSNTASLHTYFDKSLTVQFEKSLKKKIHMRIDINPFLHAILQGSETRIFWYLFHL